MKPEKWEDLPNESYRNIPKMMEAGFHIHFAYDDIKAGRIYPYKCPHLGVNFQKGNLVVWWISKGYQTACLKDGSYKEHKTYNSIEEVLKAYYNNEFHYEKYLEKK